MNRESDIYHWLRDNTEGFYSRIENTAGSGTPDCVICLPGSGTVFVECKFHSAAVRPAQHVWMTKAANHGAFCVLLLVLGTDLFAWKYPCKMEFHNKFWWPPKQPDFRAPLTTIRNDVDKVFNHLLCCK